MLTFDHEDKRFNHRVAGLCVHEAHVLLTNAEGEDYWILPGGRVELLEDSKTALRREMIEELGSEAEVKDLLWVVENFFLLAGKSYHEVSFIYEIFPTDPALLKSTWTRNTTDGGLRIEFRWFPMDGLGTVNLRPAFLKELLSNPPSNTAHLIIRE